MVHSIQYRVTDPDALQHFRNTLRARVTEVTTGGTGGGLGGGTGGGSLAHQERRFTAARPASPQLTPADLLAREIEALEDPERWDGLA